MVAVDNGDEVRLVALPWVTQVISRVTELEVEQAISPEAVEVLVIVGFVGSPTRREIEDRRGGEDCESLLARMCRRGLLEKARDVTLRGDPNVYRLTAVSLGALGHATLDSFQSWCASAISDPAATGCTTGDARS
jgi:chromosome segregation and condensation protein ScpB